MSEDSAAPNFSDLINQVSELYATSRVTYELLTVTRETLDKLGPESPFDLEAKVRILGHVDDARESLAAAADSLGREIKAHAPDRWEEQRTLSLHDRAHRMSRA